MRIGIACLLCMLSGCQSYGSMSADQIVAATKDKNAGAVCFRIVGAFGTAVTVVANLDQRVIDNGGMTVSTKDGECSVIINTAKPAPVPVAKP